MKDFKKLLEEYDKSLSFDQKKEISRMGEKEAIEYIKWLSERGFVGTEEEWMVACNQKQKQNYKLRKITELTSEQQSGTRQLTGQEVRDYMFWLYDKKGYEGGTVSEWQQYRITQTKTKKQVPIATSGGDEGFSVQRFDV